jgi:hypothetical protein
MGEAFRTAYTRIEARPTGPLVADRGSNLLIPLTLPSGSASRAPVTRRTRGQGHPSSRGKVRTSPSILRSLYWLE